MLAESLDRLPQPIDADAGRRFGLEHRRAPLALSKRLQRQARRHRLHDPIGALAVGLVHHEDVGNLHDAGLDRLHIVAGAGHQHDDRDVGGADDVHFVLADADRLDDHDVLAGGVEHQRGVARRAASPPRWPRVAMLRTNTPASSACALMRTRSPRIAPPVNGLVGSTASTPTVRPAGVPR